MHPMCTSLKLNGGTAWCTCLSLLTCSRSAYLHAYKLLRAISSSRLVSAPELSTAAWLFSVSAVYTWP